MGLINGTVTLESNHKTWQIMFEEEKERLNNIFNNSFPIEHVGSTAVKGLKAKPIIDIAIGLTSFNELDKYKEELSKYYTIKENNEHNEVLLIKEHNEETFVLIHIMLKNDKRYQNMIKFRDILINHPDILKEYEQLKERLASKYTSDRKKYTESKNEYIQSILEKY